MEETMNIYAPKGSTVKVTEKTIQNGSERDIKSVKEHLEIGKEYTVDFTDIHRYHTNVRLVEFPNIMFNSTNFVDVKLNLPVMGG